MKKDFVCVRERVSALACLCVRVKRSKGVRPSASPCLPRESICLAFSVRRLLLRRQTWETSNSFSSDYSVLYYLQLLNAHVLQISLTPVKYTVLALVVSTYSWCQFHQHFTSSFFTRKQFFVPTF